MMSTIRAFVARQHCGSAVKPLQDVLERHHTWKNDAVVEIMVLVITSCCRSKTAIQGWNNAMLAPFQRCSMYNVVIFMYSHGAS